MTIGKSIDAQVNIVTNDTCFVYGRQKGKHIRSQQSKLWSGDIEKVSLYLQHSDPQRSWGKFKAMMTWKWRKIAILPHLIALDDGQCQDVFFRPAFFILHLERDLIKWALKMDWFHDHLAERVKRKSKLANLHMKCWLVTDRLGKKKDDNKKCWSTGVILIKIQSHRLNCWSYV